MRVRRTLAGLASAAAFMTSDGCAFLKGEGCEKRTTNKLYALFIGFACLGARHEPPTAQFSLRPNPVAPGDTVDLDGTRSFAANGDDVVATTGSWTRPARVRRRPSSTTSPGASCPSPCRSPPTARGAAPSACV